MGVSMEIDLVLLAQDTPFVQRIFGKILPFLEIKKIGEKKTIELIKKNLAPKTARYVAVLDDRTTAICNQLNGKTWPIASPDIKVPPLHWNCRSQLVYEGGILL